MAAITNTSIIVDAIAIVAGDLKTFNHAFDTKAAAWKYINRVRRHALDNNAVTLCTVIVFDAAQHTGSFSYPHKEIYREMLK